MNPLISLLKKQADDLRQQGEKRSLVALFSGIGLVSSILIGFLIQSLTGLENSFYWGSVLSSLILLPGLNLTALFVWDKLRSKYFLPFELQKQLNFLREDLETELKIAESLGLDKYDLAERKREIYLEYNIKKALIFEKGEAIRQLKD